MDDALIGAFHNDAGALLAAKPFMGDKGDIQKDADASAEAGIPCIWAKYGFGHIAEPAAVLEEFAGLPGILLENGWM